MLTKTLYLLIVVAIFSPRVDAHGVVCCHKLREVLKEVVAEQNGGFGLHMWATVVDRDGTVTAVVHSGDDRGD